MKRLQGKVAIVTGAASGIGAATARMFSMAGAKVVLTDLNVQRGKRLCEQLRKEGGQVTFCGQDVSMEDDWLKVMQSAEEAFGGLDVLVNNAGIAYPNGSVEDQSLEDWQRVMQVNVDSVFLGNKYAIQAMRDTGGGSIVNISSILGMVGNPTTAAYTASKGAVRLLTKSAALHCAQSGYGIRVNSVHPGYIWTPILDDAVSRSEDPQLTKAYFESQTPLGHCGEPDDIAHGIVYLASDESKFVTGSELVIDGGYLAV